MSGGESAHEWAFRVLKKMFRGYSFAFNSHDVERLRD